jgi:hypothetical protein
MNAPKRVLHFPSGSKASFQASARRELSKLLEQRGSADPETVNAFIRRYGNALDLSDEDVRAVLRKAGFRVEREGHQWILRALDSRTAKV